MLQRFSHRSKQTIEKIMYCNFFETVHGLSNYYFLCFHFSHKCIATRKSEYPTVYIFNGCKCMFGTDKNCLFHLATKIQIDSYRVLRFSHQM